MQRQREGKVVVFAIVSDWGTQYATCDASIHPSPHSICGASAFGASKAFEPCLESNLQERCTLCCRAEQPEHQLRKGISLSCVCNTPDELRRPDKHLKMGLTLPSLVQVYHVVIWHCSKKGPRPFSRTSSSFSIHRYMARRRSRRTCRHAAYLEKSNLVLCASLRPSTASSSSSFSPAQGPFFWPYTHMTMRQPCLYADHRWMTVSHVACKGISSSFFDVGILLL